MAHEIFGRRFLDRKAAWHNVGFQNVKEELTAVEALRRIDGDFDVELAPLYYKLNGKEVLSPFNQILRHPTKDDNNFVPLGQPVGQDYRAFRPLRVCKVWDVALNDAAVETIGILRNGAMLFITTRLPTIDVCGDEVERYLGVTSPLDGVNALSAEEWPLRVVCANTLRAAQASAKVAYKVVHNEDALNYLGAWIKDAYELARQNAANLKAAFEILAKAKVDDAKAKQNFERVYPLPPVPEKNAPAYAMVKRLERHEAEHRCIERFRTEAFLLFNGKGKGMTTRAADHTAWGWVNAVTELEDFRKSTFVGGEKGEASRAAESSLFGHRAMVKQHAFDVALEMAGARAPYPAQASLSFDE